MILYNDSLQISPSMKKCSGQPQDFIELEKKDSDKLVSIIETNSQEFMNFIHLIGLDVEHTEKTTNAQNSSTTILTLKTTCFKVDFNDNFVKITALK